MAEGFIRGNGAMRMWHSAFMGIAWFFVAGASLSQVDVRDADVDMYPADTVYDPAIPTPEQFLGHALGHEPVRHHKLVEYITILQRQSAWA